MNLPVRALPLDRYLRPVPAPPPYPRSLSVVYLAAFAIFLCIRLAVWFVGLAVYRAYVGPEPLAHPLLGFITCVSVGLATLFSFVPYPWGYLLTVGVWWFAARHLFELPTVRA